MKKMLLEIMTDLRAMDQSPPVMRKFGLVSGLILFLLACLGLFKNRGAETVFSPGVLIVFGLSFFFIGVAMAFPGALKPVNSAMVVVALAIGWWVTRIVLVILFYFVFLPMGLLLKVIGKDSMHRRFDPKASSYWTLRDDSAFDPARCRRLF